MGEMKEQLGVQYWKPEEKGDSLKGVIKEVNHEGKYGVQIVVENENGELWSTPAHSMLQSRLRKAKVDRKVEITYNGKEPSTKGDDVRLYKVLIEE